MKLHPYQLPRSSDWCLEISPADTEKLADCPALRVTPQACYGAIDAIAAACYRLDRPRPEFTSIAGALLTSNYTWEHKLRGYQVEGIARIIDIQNHAGGALLADDMGCIDGDAEIIVYRNRATRRIRLSELFSKFHRLGGEWRCRALVDGIFRQHLILDVIDSGIKECIEIKLENGKSLTCTPEHEIWTPNGWISANNLAIGSEVLTNGYNVGSDNANWKGGRVIDSDGYVLVWYPDHPNAVQGKVREHRLVMEKHLGRLLNSNELIHHKNHDKQDNRIENLELTTASEHAKAHPEKWAHLDGGRTINGGEVIIIPRKGIVASITRGGPRHVYDIKMTGPYHNFVANRFIVHNCGKTVQTIYNAKIRRSQAILVACPGLARETWLDELRKWGVPEERVALVLPKGAKRRESNRTRIAEGKAQWVITSYELLDQIPELGYYTDFFIMDEAHYVKSAGRRDKAAARALKALQVGTLAPYRLALTGTPAEDRPKDFHGVLKVLLGKRLGTDYEFKVAYCDGHQGTHGFEAEGISRSEELKLRLGYYTVRREKKDVAKELPECIMNPVWLDADDKATAAFRAWVLKLTRIDDALEACLEAKIPHAISRAHEAKRFLLFTHRVEHAERMAKRLNYEGTPCKLITGALQHSERQQTIRDAETGRMGIVATIGSAGMALNLQGVASYGIMHAMTWRPGQIMQARDRIYRLGQTERVQWDYLALRDSADEHVWNTVIAKLAMQQATLESTKAIGATIDALGQMPSCISDDEALKAMYDGLPEGMMENG